MSNSGTGAGDIFDVKKVRRLVELMEQHDLAEIDLRQADQRIRLRRGAEPQYVPAPVYQPPAAAISRQARDRLRPLRKQQPRRPKRRCVTINSPMVGTFYAVAQSRIAAVRESRRPCRPGNRRSASSKR